MIVEVKLIHKPEFRVVGMTENVQHSPGDKPSENAIAKLWDRFNKRCEEIPHQIGFRTYGLIHQVPGNKPGAPFPYTAAVGVTEYGDLPEGMVRIEMPAALYAVVTYRGLLDGIGEGFGHFWKRWLPESGYIGDGMYVFEFYDQRYRDRQDPHSEIDLYFPVVAKSKNMFAKNRLMIRDIQGLMATTMDENEVCAKGYCRTNGRCIPQLGEEWDRIGRTKPCPLN